MTMTRRARAGAGGTRKIGRMTSRPAADAPTLRTITADAAERAALAATTTTPTATFVTADAAERAALAVTPVEFTTADAAERAAQQPNP